MTTQAALETLLDELDFQLTDDYICGLYFFSWALSDYREELSDEEIEIVCREGYEEINRRYPLKLVWMEWPAELDSAEDAGPDTPLDFQINATGEVTTPMLALVRLDRLPIDS